MAATAHMWFPEFKFIEIKNPGHTGYISNTKQVHVASGYQITRGRHRILPPSQNVLLDSADLV